MNPKQKAEELYTKYCLAIRTESNEFGYYTNISHAKQCALIAVDEMLNETSLGLILIDWWKEVRKEIEKL
jgi:hypothetical protein